jgi:hypothetical protein
MFARVNRLLRIILLAACCSAANADIASNGAALYVDFNAMPKLLSRDGAVPGPRLTNGCIEFTHEGQEFTISFSNRLDGSEAVSIGGWFFLKQTGEQILFSRGDVEAGPNGERMFLPQKQWVNFMLGVDQRGFFMGVVNGNGVMPFPHVTLDELLIDRWHQLVMVKTARGFQKFYHNGIMVRSDEEASAAGKIWPFHDTAPGAPVRIRAAYGGRAGEAWIFARELAAKEIQKDFFAKKARYTPAIAPVPIEVREMNQHHAQGLWKQPLTRERWPGERERIVRAAAQILGPAPKTKVPIDARTLSTDDAGTYIRRKVSIQVQPKDRMPMWLLIPKTRRAKVPAIICFYGTTSGAGKDTTVGLSGRSTNSPPLRNLAFAIDMVEAGFIAVAPDYLRDGERIESGRRPYDTTRFYEEFPDWSIHGKDSWDTSRAIDFLETLSFVDAGKIGMTGHSYGGHSTIFCAALDSRIKVAVANGPVSDFLHHGLHWAVPKGGGNSQSMPALRPYVLDPTLSLPITFYEFTTLIAPRPLLIGQAIGERRPREEENYAAVKRVYETLGYGDYVRYHWYAGDHDYPPEARRAAVDWFRHWFGRVR